MTDKFDEKIYLIENPDHAPFIVYKQHVLLLSFDRLFSEQNKEKLFMARKVSPDIQRQINMAFEQKIKSVDFYALSCHQKNDLSRFAIQYISTKGEDDFLKDLIVKTCLCNKSASPAFHYLTAIDANDPQMREIIIRLNDHNYALYYCCQFGDDADMRQIVLNSKSSQAAFEYCLNVSDDEQMQQVIVDAQDARTAYYYCLKIRNTPMMRQVILDAKEVVWALEYYANVEQDEGIKNLIMQSEMAGYMDWYLEEFGNLPAVPANNSEDY